jgi:hypothetical protein
VIEYKTVSGERFERIRQKGPPVDHVAQLALYLEVTGYPEGRLVVESRETGERMSFSLSAETGWGAWLRTRILTAHTAEEQRTLPPREISLGCETCDRWQRCFKTEEARASAVAAHPQWEPVPALPEGALPVML